MVLLFHYHNKLTWFLSLSLGRTTLLWSLTLVGEKYLGQRQDGDPVEVREERRLFEKDGESNSLCRTDRCHGFNQLRVSELGHSSDLEFEFEGLVSHGEAGPTQSQVGREQSALSVSTEDPGKGH